MKSPRPYSYIVRAGDLVFLVGPGQPAWHRRSGRAGPGRTADADDSRQRGRAAARPPASTYDDVVAARVFLTDDSFFEAMNDEYATVLLDGAAGARHRRDASSWAPTRSVEITLIASTVGEAGASARRSRRACRSRRRFAPASSCFSPASLGNTDTNGERRRRRRRARCSTASSARSTAPACRSPTSSTTRCICRTSGSSDRWIRSSAKLFPTDPPARTMVGAASSRAPGSGRKMMMTASPAAISRSPFRPLNAPRNFARCCGSPLPVDRGRARLDQHGHRRHDHRRAARAGGDWRGRHRVDAVLRRDGARHRHAARARHLRRRRASAPAAIDECHRWLFAGLQLAVVLSVVLVGDRRSSACALLPSRRPPSGRAGAAAAVPRARCCGRRRRCSRTPCSGAICRP